MRTRFAPSPTGPLHLGHAFSALLNTDIAKQMGGEMLLRLEDIDQSRARDKWETAIFDDLAWLGLSWPDPVIRQSQRRDLYKGALQSLWDMGLLYPCNCRRADIRAASDAPQEGAPVHGPDGLIYPGTCRHKPRPSQMPETAALRLDIACAVQGLAPLRYFERDKMVEVTDLVATVGDVVLARRDIGTSYHLSVTVDDADQDITHVIRGADLATATPIHVVLQRLLDLPTPLYYHHRLIRDAQGKRLAKRDDARAIARYRSEGFARDDIFALIGWHENAGSDRNISWPESIPVKKQLRRPV